MGSAVGLDPDDLFSEKPIGTVGIRAPAEEGIPATGECRPEQRIGFRLTLWHTSRMTRANSSTLWRNTAAAWLVATLVGCASLKDPQEAIIHVQASQNPAEAARLTLMGVKALHKGDVDRATAKFMAAVGADETYGPAHNNLGLLHYEQGNLFQAVLAFEEAMELMPQDPTVYYNLGLTLEAAGRVFEAMELYSQAVEMDPVNPNFLGNLVRLRVRMGEDDPTLTTQLQDLILVETRPDWRRWADRQLALTFNHALDSGPETPDFDTLDGKNRGQDDDQLNSNIIELTPKVDASVDRTPPNSQPRILSGPMEATTSPDVESLPKPMNRQPDRSQPVPIQDNGSLNRLPPSIETDRLDSEMPQDYFR